ncbi:hypothetical protein IEU95_13535 [Hoyosella rhizosphaerae]|uniref:Cell wall-binding repeat-containing protein n=1 Tax=Hoyosella rhizosphaerae TaxID=1755582 RepID=A0A916UFI5_9ACTN|nr:hypothetical protein [Hoyosella rhizosphaerae]MBN4927861.1 hypothetical protein [Hoyosella rhizosphaerae]GGC70536.1 hypothetical protein GCM10011410_24240 [Hoyosella rhizosphaerae]
MAKRSGQIVGVSFISVALVAGCTVGEGSDDGSPAQVLQPEASQDSDNPDRNLPLVVSDGASGVAVSASSQFFRRAPFAVVADQGDIAAVVRAASIGVATSVPVLPLDPADGSSVLTELERLGTATVLAVGDVPELDDVEIITAPNSVGQLSDLVGVSFEETEVSGLAEIGPALGRLDPSSPTLLTLTGSAEHSADARDAEEPDADELGAETGENGSLPEFGRSELANPVLALVAITDGESGSDAVQHIAAAATSKAAGADLKVLGVPDPRATGESVEALREHSDSTVVAIGDHFGSVTELRDRIEFALTVPELPGGGQLLYPGRRMIALYGHPGVPAMGVMGEQGPEESVARAKELASQYDPFSDEKVIPALEVIVTVASVDPGTDNQYSNRSRVDDIRPWVEAARDTDTYVVLDLQPGRTDFLTQAKIYEELLAEPHVGLALDPEWRLRPDQVHLRQVGQVDASEINDVIEWLADLTAENNLPQKLLILHQFQTRMITNRADIDTSRDEVSVLIHADGHGVPEQKLDTWNVLKQDLPEGVWLGWKNFNDEDSPTFTPEETMDVSPSPWFVSYQ